MTSITLLAASQAMLACAPDSELASAQPEPSVAEALDPTPSGIPRTDNAATVPEAAGQFANSRAFLSEASQDVLYLRGPLANSEIAAVKAGAPQNVKRTFVTINGSKVAYQKLALHTPYTLADAGLTFCMNMKLLHAGVQEAVDAKAFYWTYQCFQQDQDQFHLTVHAFDPVAGGTYSVEWDGVLEFRNPENADAVVRLHDANISSAAMVVE